MQTATLRLIGHSSISSNQRRWLGLLCILMLGWLNPLSCLWHCDRSNELSAANQQLDAGIFICLIAESQPPANLLHTHAPNSNPNPANQGLFKLLGHAGLMMMLSWRWRKYCAAPLLWQSQASEPPLAPPPKLIPASNVYI